MDAGPHVCCSIGTPGDLKADEAETWLWGKAGELHFVHNLQLPLFSGTGEKDEASFLSMQAVRQSLCPNP